MISEVQRFMGARGPHSRPILGGPRVPGRLNEYICVRKFGPVRVTREVLLHFRRRVRRWPEGRELDQLCHPGRPGILVASLGISGVIQAVPICYNFEKLSGVGAGFIWILHSVAPAGANGGTIGGPSGGICFPMCCPFGTYSILTTIFWILDSFGFAWTKSSSTSASGGASWGFQGSKGGVSHFLLETLPSVRGVKLQALRLHASVLSS
jgi:hypothetical protein